MQESDLQRRHRLQLGLRVGPQMAEYVQRKAAQAPPRDNVTIIGSDARTGVPIRRPLTPAELKTLMEDQ